MVGSGGLIGRNGSSRLCGDRRRCEILAGRGVKSSPHARFQSGVDADDGLGERGVRVEDGL